MCRYTLRIPHTKASTAEKPDLRETIIQAIQPVYDEIAQHVEHRIRPYTAQPVRYPPAVLALEHLGGRPTKYTPEKGQVAFCILADCRRIGTVRYVAAVLGISRTTLYEWYKLHPEFAFAIDAGKAVQESYLATLLAHGVPQWRGILFILKNLHGWSDHPKEPSQSSLPQTLAALLGQSIQLRDGNLHFAFTEAFSVLTEGKIAMADAIHPLQLSEALDIPLAGERSILGAR